MSKNDTPSSVASRKPVWEPSRNAIHRLIQVMDVLAASLWRFRQLSLERAHSDPSLPEGSGHGASRNAYLTELRDDWQRVLLRVFPANVPQHATLARWVDDAVHAANEIGLSNALAAIGSAGEWVGQVGLIFASAPPDAVTADDRERFEFVEQMLESWGDQRDNLFRLLRRHGQPVTDEVELRRLQILNSQMPLMSVAELSRLVDEAEPVVGGKVPNNSIHDPVTRQASRGESGSPPAVAFIPPNIQPDLPVFDLAAVFREGAQLRARLQITPAAERTEHGFVVQTERLRRVINPDSLPFSPQGTNGWLDSVDLANHPPATLTAIKAIGLGLVVARSATLPAEFESVSGLLLDPGIRLIYDHLSGTQRRLENAAVTLIEECWGRPVAEIQPDDRDSLHGLLVEYANFHINAGVEIVPTDWRMTTAEARQRGEQLSRDLAIAHRRELFRHLDRLPTDPPAGTPEPLATAYRSLATALVAARRFFLEHGTCPSSPAVDDGRIDIVCARIRDAEAAYLAGELEFASATPDVFGEAIGSLRSLRDLCNTAPTAPRGPFVFAVMSMGTDCPPDPNTIIPRLRSQLGRIVSVRRAQGTTEVASTPGGTLELKTGVSSKSTGDGPEGGCWLWWEGQRHLIPKDVVFRLIDFMWNRDSARYDALKGPVFEEEVLTQTISARTSQVNKKLQKIGIPWTLTSDARTRHITKRQQSG